MPLTLTKSSSKDRQEMCSSLMDIAGMQGGQTLQTVTAARSSSIICAPMCRVRRTAASTLILRTRPGYLHGSGNYSGSTRRQMIDHPDDLTELVSRLKSEDYCYLTTTGRVSGRPHEIEIWFAIKDNTLYLLSGGGDKSDWVRNLRAYPAVTVRIGKYTFTGKA